MRYEVTLGAAAAMAMPLYFFPHPCPYSRLWRQTRCHCIPWSRSKPASHSFLFHNSLCIVSTRSHSIETTEFDASIGNPHHHGQDDVHTAGDVLLQEPLCQRRRTLILALTTIFVSQQCPMPSTLLQRAFGLGEAQASLVQMPPTNLNNRYYLVRSGESEFESFGIINTNPVDKTNLQSGLSENGKKQALQAAIKLREMGACEGSCWIWPSITQRAYQAAEIIAYLNNINRSRIVPEYSFLDARGVGAYEGKSLDLLSKVYEIDAESPYLRPPPYTDGTPNESVEDVFVRVRQLMSVLETQYFGESIVIVAPDSDNLSILQAALTGLDLRRHTSLYFAPGEVRYVEIEDR